MMEQELEDYDDQLINRIRHFLVKDVNFRRADFDPAPYLIKVLKEKEANQQLLFEKQKQLVELENEAQELIRQAVAEKNEDFFSLLAIPKQFGRQLEQLKHGMAKVKKKVKQTKGLLLATQKDIQQMHLNCNLNKLVYTRLKEVDVKLEQYESAALALKNHLYLDCAMNLPSFTGNSTLQHALALRTQNLKLRFISQAIEQVRLFLYFTPRLAVPVKHSFLDRMEGSQEAFNLETHSAFYKRYLLFCKAKCQDYIGSIWQIVSLKQRKGKVSTIDGIVQGIMRIGKSSDITDSLSLDCKKSITNIFTVMYYFFAKDIKNTNISNRRPWLTSPQTDQHTIFLEALFSISAALIRKIVVVRHICFDYQLLEVCDRLATERVLEMIRDEILNFVTDVYFYEGEQALDSFEHPLVKVRQYSSFAIWPYFKHRIQSCFSILTEHLTTVENELFHKTIPDEFHYFKPFSILQKKFNQAFHREILKDIESVFPEGRGLIPENYDSILATRKFKPQQLEFVSKYVTEDRRSLREYVNVVSLLISLKNYFENNKYDPERMKIYSTFILIFFYLKTNSAVFRSLISPSAYDKIIDTRSKDGKVKNKQKFVESQFANLAVRKDKRKIEKKFKILQGDSVPLRNAQQLKMVRAQMQMLLFYCLTNLPPSTQTLANLYTDKLESQIDKHQPSNYDDNLSAKIMRVWQQLVKPVGQGEGIDSLLAAIYRRMLDLYLTVLTSVYLQTGTM